MSAVLTQDLPVPLPRTRDEARARQGAYDARVKRARILLDQARADAVLCAAIARGDYDSEVRNDA